MGRRLSRAAELIHGVNYYAPEINRFVDHGFRGWWHSYMAYRAAPMGPVDAPLVGAAFYNFAPRMIERAVPGVWVIMAPEDVLVTRNALVAEAMTRIFDDFEPVVTEAAALAHDAVADLDPGARPLSAALAGLPWPEGPAMTLWHACSVWREFRGDSHNIALASAGIDGCEAHVLMSAAGHGNQPTIAAIRGWTEDEWLAASARLQGRGYIDDQGRYTAAGEAFRSEIERTTDQLSAAPVARLGPERSARLYELFGVLGGHLTATGEVPGVWPPPAVQK